MRSTRGRRRASRPMSDINITPMVDVMLVLLIIFMVAAPLMVTGVSVDLPKTSAKALPAEDRPISVTVDRAGLRYIGDEELSREAFVARLEALYRERGGETRVVVRADSQVPYGGVAALLADVTKSGFARVALVNSPEAVVQPQGGDGADGDRPRE